MTTHEVLKRYFGYDEFRIGQSELIDGLMAGRDVLGIMPTGAGKSICFQIPALMMDGVALVVSPLISLMKDQVSALTQSGVPAAFINSSLTPRQIDAALRNAAEGRYKLIYVAPERLPASDFLSFVKSVRVSMLTVDEAHCISQWGQDFRPSYAQIPEFIAELPSRPVVSAFTATATPRVREDIVNLLGLRDPRILITGFDRENLRFDVLAPKRKYRALAEFLKDKRDRSGIVYCSTRKLVEEVCEKLRNGGYGASRYHAGLDDSERRGNQDDFLYDRAQIMVATNAFGMGIDKSNVSFVVHYNMPKDIESYYQEAGRAGRDGSPADCLLLYSGQDVRRNEWMIENDKDAQYPDRETERMLKERARERLRKMTFYSTTVDCQRGFILKYFGETPPNFCGNCGNCDTADFENVDITIDAQKILSCVARMGERFGTRVVMDVLRGNRNDKTEQYGFDKLSTFGICNGMQVRRLRHMIDFLITRGYLIKTKDEYPVIKLGSLANGVLRQGEKIEMKMAKDMEQSQLFEDAGDRQDRGRRSLSDKPVSRQLDKPVSKTFDKPVSKQLDKAVSKQLDKPVSKPFDKPVSKPFGKPVSEPSVRSVSRLFGKLASRPFDRGLFETLRKQRAVIAKEQGVPAFVVFSDSTLVDMCIKAPRGESEFLRVSGVGNVKLEKYGNRFLDAINEYLTCPQP